MSSGHYEDVITRGRRGTIRLALVGGVVAVALVAAVVALVAWASPGPGPATPPTADGSANAGPSTPSALGADALATPGLAVEMPSDLVWRDVCGVALPHSASKGPRNTLGGLASGFAHDPAGAVLAAAHIIMRINPENGPAVFEPTLREQVVGPDVASIRTIINEAYNQLRLQAGVPYGDPVGGITAVMRGFRVESYTGTDVDVRLVAEGPDANGGTSVSAMLLHLRWSNDDWLVVAPAGGDFVAAYVPVDSASIYTPLSER